MARDSKAKSTPITEDDDFVPVDVRRVLITTFVLVQLMATALWLMPASATQNWALSPLRRYIWAVGCDQNWNMFAPNPAAQDIYLSADITYQDGTRKSWTFPRMCKLNYLQRYQEERFRKLIEFAHQDGYAVMWQPLAQFAALANNKNPKTDPVVHVELIRHFLDIPAPGTPLPPYSAYNFYRADFAPGSLPQ